jgi:hypothetical protein
MMDSNKPGGASADAGPQPNIERRVSKASRASNAVEQADEGILAEFGYKQELRRDWSLMHNFGISFSIIVRNPRFLPKNR